MKKEVKALMMIWMAVQPLVANQFGTNVNICHTRMNWNVV
jgi:hypothetical protein